MWDCIWEDASAYDCKAELEPQCEELQSCEWPNVWNAVWTWNGDTCTCNCPAHSTFDEVNGCECDWWYVLEGNECVKAECTWSIPKYWSANNSRSPSTPTPWYHQEWGWSAPACTYSCIWNSYWNGSTCLCSAATKERCISWQWAPWDWDDDSCDCDCPQWTSYNQQDGTCDCPSGEFWDGDECRQECPQGQRWDGTSCVSTGGSGGQYSCDCSDHPGATPWACVWDNTGLCCWAAYGHGSDWYHCDCQRYTSLENYCIW